MLLFITRWQLFQLPERGEVCSIHNCTPVCVRNAQALAQGLRNAAGKPLPPINHSADIQNNHTCTAEVLLWGFSFLAQALQVVGRGGARGTVMAA